MKPLLILVPLLLFACADHDGPKSAAAGPSGPQSYAPLVELDDWQGVAQDDDPFLTAQSEAPTCVAAGFRVEEDLSWLELDTTTCSWITVSAAARHAVAKGQMLKLNFSHYDLNAPEPASAELRLTLKDCAAWSKSIAIPSPADVYVEELASPCALAEGDKVLFHLHNHGQNTYQLQSVSVLR